MIKTKYGRTALHCACAYGNENASMEIISKLLEIGGRELLMMNEDRKTALHCACENKNVLMEIISKMLEMGGRELFMMKSAYYGTALHCAYIEETN